MTKRVFPATDSALSDVLEFVEQTMACEGCSPRMQMQISICVEEVFVNVAHYAYPDCMGEATVGLACQNGELTITVADHGIPFDPLARPEVDAAEVAAGDKIGGLGIYMVKKSVDALHYERKDGENRLTMVKKL